MAEATASLRMRSAGILLHVSSLPGPYGIGDLGPAAYEWIDALARAKQSWWQLLPLGYGESPYQCLSAFAGSPNLISPAMLLRDGLLTPTEAKAPRLSDNHVDFPRVRRLKSELLHRAWDRFQHDSAIRRKLRHSFDDFRRRHSQWLDDFTLFMALKESNDGRAWTSWSRDLLMRKPAALRSARLELADAIDRHRFTQFLFFRQLDQLKRYANDRGVRLIGDLPIFISGDSADVWSHPHQFQLDKNRQPTVVAGVPPDLFSRTGQRWGNPIYNWRAMQRDHFAWWIARFKSALDQADVVRIDHFRGFAACWQIPANHPTAERGRWVKAPGRELFETLRTNLGGLPFIAEDLGTITPDVIALRDELGLPGMRILHFAFNGDPTSSYLPHNYVRNAVAYTGTHDNDTTVGWFASLSRKQKTFLHQYIGNHTTSRDIAWDLMRLCWSSIANCAIAPLQDVLSLNSKARMNIPGTCNGNWRWRVRQDQLDNDALDRLAALTQTYARG